MSTTVPTLPLSISDSANESPLSGREPFASGMLLTHEGEIALARRIERGERIILRALLGSPVTLRELAGVGREVAEGRLQARDVLRATEEAERDDEQVRVHLVTLLDRAGALASALERGVPVRSTESRALQKALEHVRVHRRILERVVAALRASPPVDGEGARRTRKAIDVGRRIADTAKGDLVGANLRLVVSFAKRYLGHGLPLSDLVQEGSVALMLAADKFDHRRGYRFSTYATWWVRQQMARAVHAQARTIRVPEHLEETRRRARRAQQAFELEHGRAPSEAEIASRIGVSTDKVSALEELTPEPISLDASLGEEGELRLGDLAADQTTPAPDEALAHARLREQVKSLVTSLSPREVDVLRRRFGLDDGREHSLEEIGASLSLSRERVRQIEMAALRRLRAPSRRLQLATYLTG